MKNIVIFNLQTGEPESFVQQDYFWVFNNLVLVKIFHEQTVDGEFQDKAPSDRKVAIFHQNNNHELAKINFDITIPHVKLFENKVFGIQNDYYVMIDQKECENMKFDFEDIKGLIKAFVNDKSHFNWWIKDFTTSFTF